MKKRIVNVFLSLMISASMFAGMTVPSLAVENTAVVQTVADETEDTETEEVVKPAIAVSEVDRKGGDFSISLEGYSDDWKEKITKVTFNDDELEKDQYEVRNSDRGASLILKRTEEKPLISGKERETKATVTIEADGYETVEAELTFKCYGAENFQLRIVKTDDEGNVIERIPVRTFSWDELESMKESSPVYYQTGCGSGVTTFMADGVYLEDLFKAAGITPTTDMMLKLRVGDCVGPESGWTNPDGYRIDMTYGDLMEKDRYFFDGAYTDETVKEAFTNGGYGDEEARKALAKTDKTLVKPMMALRYVEEMYDAGKPSEDTKYSKIVEEEKALRFLFGLAIDKDENGDLIAEEDGHRWSTSYMSFGIDVVDNEGQITVPTPILKTNEIDREANDFYLGLNNGSQAWADRITSVKFNGIELTKDQYEYTENRRGASLVLKRTEEKPLIIGKDREVKADIEVKADGFTDLKETLIFKCYGAKSFELRVVKTDDEGNVIERTPVKTFSWKELESMRESSPVYYQTGCGSGVTTFMADGVYLEDLFEAAGVKPTTDMMLKLRVGDCVGPEGGWTNPDGYRIDMTYGDLMERDRYFFDGAYTDETVKEAFTNGGYGDEASRKALAKTDKTLVKPMMALRYIEVMYKEGKPSADSKYSQIIEDEKALRFLFGLGLEENENGELIAEADGHRWSTSYMSFGIDIVDNEGVLDVKPAAKAQWKHDSNGWWYEYADGSYANNGFTYIEGHWYFFNKAGYMVTGWVKDSGAWYYMNKSGEMTTGWVYADGSWYYMNKSGEMTTGWVYADSSWYYMNKSGEMATGWVYADGSWYYMNKSGEMTTGWVYADGSWYYMNKSGKMATGWIYVDGSWYYLYKNGSMASNTTVEGCVLNKNGQWIK